MEQNNAQKQASKFSSGSHLVLAGAGTGKTATMIKRIENTLPHAEKANKRIIVLTFSKKAAEEIKQRLFKKNIELEDRLTAGTIHSFAYEIIKSNLSAFNSIFNRKGTPEIICEERELEIFSKFFRMNKTGFLGIPCNTVLSIYREKANRPDILQKNDLPEVLIKNIKIISETIDSYKRENNLLNFSEIITSAEKVLSNDKVLRHNISDKIFALFIDEFQDISQKDMNLLKLMQGANRNIFMVGDDYQSIYGFRGSDVKIIMNMKKYYADIKTHKLTVNYRSHSEIIKLAEKIIKHNRFRTKKKLVSHSGKGASINLLKVMDSQDEILKIKSLLSENQSSVRTAILVRNNWQIKLLQDSLNHALNPDIEIMTIHKSKGLEFERVIITGINDELFPSPLSELEEERRLFFVAITRAMKELVIIYHKQKETPRFIREIS